MQVKFNVFWKKNLGTLYKDNSIDTVGKEANVDIDLKQVHNIYATFKVGDKTFTDLVEIVDIETGLINIPFKTDVIKLGTNELELVANMKNGSVMPSQTYTYTIDKSLENPNSVEAETNYPILIELLQEVGEKISDTNEAINRLDSSVEEMKNNINNSLNQNTEIIANSLKENTNTINSHIEESLEVIGENFNTYIKDTDKDIANKLENYSNKTTSNINTVLENKSNEVDEILSNKIIEVDTKVNNKASELTNKVNNKTSELTSKVNAKITEVNNILEASVNTLDRVLENEDRRLSNETERVSNENIRNVNEVDRIEAENQRVVNENLRKEKIIGIQNDYNSLKKVIIDENASANLQNQINNVNSQLAHIESVADIPTYNLRKITKELGVTQGIQKVFDEVGETGIGRILLDKVYEIDEPLILNRTNTNTNTSIEIYGGGCLKKSSNFVGDQLILLKIGYHDEDNIIFNNISFDGVDRSCNAVDNFSNLSFDSECSDSSTNNMSKFVKFYNCSFSNFYHGVRLSSLSYVFSGCLFTMNNYGVYLDCSANANIFTGCSMRRNVIGVKIKQFSSTIGSISNGFYNCTIESNTNLGILSQASRNSKIIGCYFENNGFSINPDFENFDSKKVHIWLDDKGGAGMHTIDSFFNTSNFDIAGRFVNSVILNKCSLYVEYASESTFINIPLSKITFIGMRGYPSSFNLNGVEYISDKNTQKLYKKDEFNNNSLVFRTKNYGLYERETVDQNLQSIELATLTVSNFQGAILNFNSILFGLTAYKNQISCGAIKGRIVISKATNGEEEYIAHIDDLSLLNCEGASSGAGEGLTTLGLFGDNSTITATTNNNTIVLTLENIEMNTLTNWGKLYYIQKAITANFELINSNSYEINTEFLTLS